MSPRLLSAWLVAVVLTVAGCTELTSSAGNDVPVSTIGIGSEANSEVVVSADVPPTTSTVIDTVIMIGDSITVASTPALQEMYEQLGFDEIIIESKQGKRTAQSFGSNPRSTSPALSSTRLTGTTIIRTNCGLLHWGLTTSISTATLQSALQPSTRCCRQSLKNLH